MLPAGEQGRPAHGSIPCRVQSEYPACSMRRLWRSGCSPRFFGFLERAAADLRQTDRRGSFQRPSRVRRLPIAEPLDAPPTSSGGFDHRYKRRLDSDVRFECDAFSACLSRYGDRLLGGGEIVVDRQHLGAFLRETQNRGAAITQAFAWRLTCAYDDGDLVLETHANQRAK